ncbi:hypothetical protein A2U01_0114659, partial [Trifolium medium]|nr:hypothetical protein [Trifolium medium]
IGDKDSSAAAQKGGEHNRRKRGIVGSCARLCSAAAHRRRGVVAGWVCTIEKEGPT